MSAQVRPGYKQTDVGVIPEDWDVALMTTITAQIGDGLHGTPVYSSNGNYYFVNGNNLRDGKLVFTNETKTVDYSEFTKNRKNLSDSSILMSINGTVGNLGIFRGEAVVLGKSAAYLNIKNGISKLFVYHSLQTEAVKSQFFDGMTGSTIGNLGLTTIRNAKVPIPPTKAEQEAIAEALTDSDALIESLEQIVTKKRQIKQGAMQELLTGKKRLPGFSEEWEVKCLGDVADIDADNLGSATHVDYAFNYISLEDVDLGSLRSYSQQIFRTAPSRARRRLRDGDILISTVRPNLQSHLLFTSAAEDWICSTGFSVIRCKKKDAAPGYIFCHFFGHQVIKQIETLLTGSNYPAINGRDVRALEIPMPTLPEQTAIARALSDMEAEIADLAAQLVKIRNIKQGMMHKLLTGEIRLI